MPTPRKVVFLDRDGTINVDHGYVHKIEDWEFTDRAIEALLRLQRSGYSLAVVTNQAGIADGRYDEAAVDTLHDHVAGLLADAGVRIDAIAYSADDRNSGSEFRKPKPGMAGTIEQQIGPIDYANSWVVGDKISDVGFGKNIGAKTALIRSRYWEPDSIDTYPDTIVDSLFEFAMNTPSTSNDFDTTHWRVDKVLTPAEAADVAERLRKKGQRLVTVNGSFDLVHAGHLDQLEEARKQGDVLFVGINVDRAITEAKGKDRPLVPEQARAAMLAALVCVDYVVLMPGSYSEEPMKSLLESVKPHIHVNGPDYGPVENWVEWPTMQKFDTQGHTIRKRNDFSTSSIIKKIKSSLGSQS